MSEIKAESLQDVLKDFEFAQVRRPVKGDYVYVRSQKAIFKVESVEAMVVTIERSHKGSGLKLKLPPSQYQLLEKK